jgi:hypothetical protein
VARREPASAELNTPEHDDQLELSEVRSDSPLQAASSHVHGAGTTGPGGRPRGQARRLGGLSELKAKPGSSDPEPGWEGAPIPGILKIA